MRKLVFLLAILFIIPNAIATQHETITITTNYHEEIDPFDGIEIYPSRTQTSQTLSNCGDSLFTINQTWFRFYEREQELGCGELRFNLTAPSGAHSAQIQFWADRYVQATNSPFQLPINMPQTLRHYDEHETTPTTEYFYFAKEADTQTGISLSYTYPVQNQSLEFSWYFEDAGYTVFSPISNHVLGQSLTATIANPKITYMDIPLNLQPQKTDILVNDEWYKQMTYYYDINSNQDITITAPEKCLIKIKIDGEELNVQNSIIIHNQQKIVTLDEQLFTIDGAILEIIILDQLPPETPLWMSILTILINVVPLVPLTLLITTTLAQQQKIKKHHLKITGTRLTNTLLGVGITLIHMIVLLIILNNFTGSQLVAIPITLPTIIMWTSAALTTLLLASLVMILRKRMEPEINEQIRQQEEMEKLSDKNKMQTEFFNTASHELNTPLTPIKTELYLLKNGTLGELTAEQQDAVEAVDRNFNQLRAIVSDMVGVAQNNKPQLKMQALDITNIVTDTVKTYRNVAKERQIKMELRTTTKPCKISGDKIRLQQVLENLINNAIKYTPNGGNVRVTVDAVGDKICINIRDTGLGMTMEQQAKLGEPFTRFHELQKIPGSGLGIYICKNIINQHNGKLAVHSDGVNKGTRILIELPKQ